MPFDAAVPQDTSIAIIGAGRLGAVLARALRVARFDVHGPFGRDELPRSGVRFDIALLCVPDSAIAAAAASARPHTRLIGHVSGATPLDDVDFSIHPLQTFTGNEPAEIFHGLGAAVAGRTPETHVVATLLAEALGAHPFTIDDEHRAGYHAAASLTSNFTLTVLDAAEQLAGQSGIPAADARALLAPIVRQSVENWIAHGASAALTGPIARGDEGTVTRQRAAIPVELRDLFDVLASATRTLAERSA